MNIANQLQIIKKEYNLTQAEMAKLAKVSQSTISDWLNGKINPTIDNLAKLADALQISLDYLIGRENEEGNIIINNNNEQYSTEDLYILKKIKNLSVDTKDIIIRLIDTINKNKKTTNQYNNNGTHNGNVNF